MPMTSASGLPSTSPLRSPARRALTSPKPFNLVGTSRHEVAESSRQHMISEKRAAEEQARAFKARPMPLSEGWKPTVDGKHTTPHSFELKSDARSALHQDQLQQRVLEAEASARRAPLEPLIHAPHTLFPPQPSSHPMLA